MAYDISQRQQLFQDIINKNRAERAISNAEKKVYERHNTAIGIRIYETVADTFGRILIGASKSIEGIGDVGLLLWGYTQDEEERAKIKAQIERDRTYELIGQYLQTENSYLNEASPFVQRITRETFEGLGQMLPSVAVSIIPVVGQAMALGTLGVGAAGMSTEQALNEGATYNQAALYGAIAGTIEVITEKMFGSFTKNVYGTGFADKVASRFLKTPIARFAAGLLEEGVEEWVATAVEPLYREIYQKGAIKELGTSEHWQQAAEDMLVGSLTALLYEGSIGQFSKTQRAVTESMEAISALQERQLALESKGKLTLQKETGIQTDILREAGQIEKLLQKMKPERRAKYIKNYNLSEYFDEAGNIKEDGVSRFTEEDTKYNRESYSANLRGNVKNLKYKPMKNTAQVSAEIQLGMQMHSAFNKKAGAKTGLVFTNDINIANQGKAFYDEGIIYASADASLGDIARVQVVHEMTHTFEQFDNTDIDSKNKSKTAYGRYKAAIMEALRYDPAVREELGAYEDIEANVKEAYRDQLAKAESQLEKEWIITTEIAAHISEKLFTSQKVVQRLTQTNRTVAQKIYNFIKTKLTYMKNRFKNPNAKGYLDFLEKAERLYSKAIEQSKGGIKITDVRRFGKIIDEADTLIDQKNKQDNKRHMMIGTHAGTVSIQVDTKYKKPDTIEKTLTDRFKELNLPKVYSDTLHDFMESTNQVGYDEAFNAWEKNDYIENVLGQESETSYKDVENPYNFTINDMMEIINVAFGKQRETFEYISALNKLGVLNLNKMSSALIKAREKYRTAIANVETATKIFAGEMLGFDTFENERMNKLTEEEQDKIKKYQIELLSEARAKILKDTGWYVGPDEGFRYEISTKDVLMRHEIIQQAYDSHRQNEDIFTNYLKHVDGYDYSFDENKMSKRDLERLDDLYTITLEEIIDAPSLFEAYPELRSIAVVFRNTKAYIGQAGRGIINLSYDSFMPSEIDPKLLHEQYYAYVRLIEKSISETSIEKTRQTNFRDATEAFKEEHDGKMQDIENRYGITFKKIQTFLKDSQMLSKEDRENISTLFYKTKNVNFKRVLIHEIQHLIQTIEGFSRGGDVDYTGEKIAEIKKDRTNDYILNKIANSQEYDNLFHRFMSAQSAYQETQEYKELATITSQKQMELFFKEKEIPTYGLTRDKYYSFYYNNILVEWPVYKGETLSSDNLIVYNQEYKEMIRQYDAFANYCESEKAKMGFISRKTSYTEQFREYENIYGEAEARYASNRMSITQETLEENRELPLYDLTATLLKGEYYAKIYDENVNYRYQRGFHGEDLGKSEPYNWIITGRRSSGHFGTGTYFVSDPSLLTGEYEKRPIAAVDLDKYNLYRASNSIYANILHDDILKVINYNDWSIEDVDKVINQEDIDRLANYVKEQLKDVKIDGPSEPINNVLKKIAPDKGWYYESFDEWIENFKEEFRSKYTEKDFNEENIERIGRIIRETAQKRSEIWQVISLATLIMDRTPTQIANALKETIQTTSKGEYIDMSKWMKNNNLDSASTLFMKALGYEGVDVRGQSLDNTYGGTVVYNLDLEDVDSSQNNWREKYMIDSDGNLMTTKSATLFADSQARDDKGHLLVMYHESPNVENNTESGENGFFFTDSQDTGEIHKVYLNMVNPFDARYMSDQEIKEVVDNSYLHLDEDDVKIYITVPNKALLKKAININELQKRGYDGYIGYINSGESKNIYTEYVVFKSDQIKTVDNLAPTEGEDIRYLKEIDSKKREMAPGQTKYFVNSQARDRFARLKVLYHGSNSFSSQFNIFKSSRNGQFVAFFTDKKSVAASYVNEELDTNENVYEVYLNLKNPFVIECGGNYWINLRNALLPDGTRVAQWLPQFTGYISTETILQKVQDMNAKMENKFDGIIFKHIIDTGMLRTIEYPDNPSNVYVAFEQNQIKRVSNKNPTDSIDIRYQKIINEAQEKKYNSEEIKTAVDDILVESLLGYDERFFTEFSKDKKKAIMTEIVLKIKRAKNKSILAADLARYILESAVMVEDNSDIGAIIEHETTVYNALRGYFHKINLDSIRSEIKYRYGADDPTPFFVFGRRYIKNIGQTLTQAERAKNYKETGVDPSVAYEELVDLGFIQAASNEVLNAAEQFFKIYDAYTQARNAIQQSKKVLTKTVIEMVGETEYNKILATIQEKIEKMLETQAEPATKQELLQQKKLDIELLEKRLATAQTQLESLQNNTDIEIKQKNLQINNLQGEIAAITHELNNVKAQSAIDKSHVQFLLQMVQQAFNDVNIQRAKVKDAKVRTKAILNLYTTVQRVKGLKKFLVNEVQLGNQVKYLITKLSGVVTWAGNLSKNIRTIMAEYAKNYTDSNGNEVPLFNLLTGTDGEKNPYANKIDNIARGKGDLTTQEIQDLDKILKNFIHNVHNYDRVIFEDKETSDIELIDQFKKEIQSMVKLAGASAVGEILHKYKTWIESPLNIVERRANYDKNSILLRFFEWFYQQTIKQARFEKHTAEIFEDFFKRNKRIEQVWRKVINIGGFEISKGQAITLYMISLRQQSQGHLYNRTITKTVNGVDVEIKQGVIRIANEKKAQNRNIPEAVDTGTDVTITENFAKAIENSLTEVDKEFITLAQKFFQEDSAVAYKETMESLYGVEVEIDPDYIPIRSVRDQFYHKMGTNEVTDFSDVITAYSPAFTKDVVPNAATTIVIENILDVINRHRKQMATFYGMAVAMKSWNRVWNKKVADPDVRVVAKANEKDVARFEKTSVAQTMLKVDPEFERNFNDLLRDMQSLTSAKDTYDALAHKVIMKFRKLGMIAALAINLKVILNQTGSLFSSHNVGFHYRNIFYGAIRAYSGKVNFRMLEEYCPLMWKRFQEGQDIDMGTLMERSGIGEHAKKIEDFVSRPAQWMDKMVIGALWEGALRQTKNDNYAENSDAHYKAAAKLVDEAVRRTQANLVPINRPAVLRSKNSLIKLGTMFMTEQLQIFSQIAKAVDKTKVARVLLKQATTDVERSKAEAFLKEAKRESHKAFVSVMVTQVWIAVIAVAMNWLKKRREEDDPTYFMQFIEDLASGFIGMFPFIRDIYSYIQGYDITNTAYSGMANIGQAITDIKNALDDITDGTPSTTNYAAVSRQLLLGTCQMFGIPLRNLETYTKGILEKFVPSATETYESWFYKKSNTYYIDAINKAADRGNEHLADTLTELMINNKIRFEDKSIESEIVDLYRNGYSAIPAGVPLTLTLDGTEYDLTDKQYKDFRSTYFQAEQAVRTMMNSRAYRVADDEVKAKAIKLIYEYYYNNAKENFFGESFNGKLGYLAKIIPIEDIAVVIATAGTLETDKDRAGKAIAGSKKVKVQRLLYTQRFTANQRSLLMAYFGYSDDNAESALQRLLGASRMTSAEKREMIAIFGF